MLRDSGREELDKTLSIMDDEQEMTFFPDRLSFSDEKIASERFTSSPASILDGKLTNLDEASQYPRAESKSPQPSETRSLRNLKIPVQVWFPAWRSSTQLEQVIEGDISAPPRHRASAVLRIKGSANFDSHNWSQQIRAMRSLNMKIRAEMFEMRKELRDLRSSMNVANEAFMKIIRERRMLDFESGNSDVLKDAFRELHEIRENYGPLEDRYNEAEEDLDRKEYKLMKMEKMETPEEMIPEMKPLTGTESQLSRISARNNVRNLEDSRAKEMRNAYLSKLGDADMCREELMNLRSEFKELCEAIKTTDRRGLDLAAEDQLFLDRYPTEEARLLQELDEIEEDAKQLKMEWKQETNESSQNTTEYDWSNPEVASLSSSQRQEFPILLQNGEEAEVEEGEALLEMDDASNRIARWLLHKLRSSYSEVQLLFRIFRDGGNIVDKNEWQRQVLRLWYADASIFSQGHLPLDPKTEVTTILSNSRPPQSHQGVNG